MGYVKAETSQKASQYVKIAKVLHQLPCFCEVVEIPCYFYDASDVVVGILLVGGLFNAGEQIIEVLIGDREFFK